MSQTHWKKLHNPDYLGAYSFEPGKDIIGTIKQVKTEMVTGPDNRKEECSVIHFHEKIKPLVLNVTNAKTIAKIYDTPYIEEWVDKKIQMYATKVKAFGDFVEAVRIRQKVPTQVNITTKCTDCGNEIKAYGNMTAEQMAKYTYTKYGKELCSDCATKAKGES
jgi:hypothetical protein